MVTSLGWAALNLLLVWLSFYFTNLAHELGHLVAGNLLGLPSHKLFIGLPLHAKQPSSPTARIFGVSFYIGASSLYAFVRTNERALKQLAPRRRIIIFLAGPVCGAIASAAWAAFFFLSLHSLFQLTIGIAWVFLNLGNLWGQRENDGHEIRLARRELEKPSNS